MAGKNGSSYMLLFNAIAEQEVYDEESIKKKLRNEKFIKHLSVTKSQLYDLVLRILRFSQQETSTHVKIFSSIDAADILFARSLYDAAFYELDKARKLCEEAGFDAELLLVTLRERRFHSVITTTRFPEIMDAVDQKGRHILLSLQRQHDLQGIYYKIMFFMRSERFIRTPEQEAYLDNLAAHPALQVPFEELGFRGKITHLMFLKMYWQLKNEEEKSVGYMQQVVQTYNSHPSAIAAEPMLYVNAIVNLLNIYSKMKRSAEVEHYIKAVDEKTLHNNPLAMGMFRSLKANYAISAYQESNRFEELATLAPSMLEELDQYKNHMNSARYTATVFNLMLVYLYNRMYGEMLTLVNRLLDVKEDDINREFLAHTRIYQLIVHYELGNMVLLESIVRSAKHFLQTREHFYETERIAISHFARLTSAADKYILKERFTDMLRELKHAAETNELEEKFQEQTLLHIWLEAKISGQTMLQVYRQQVTD